jgi:heterodisulfide reductase subunit B
MTLAYYPGCSLHKSSGELDVSTRKVLEVLGVEYQEVPEWTCCGSTPAHMMDHLLAQALAARNLRQAAEVGDELLAPCPSCYQREKNAEIEIHADEAFRAEVNSVLDKPYEDRVTCYSLPEFLMECVGEEKIAALVKTDLSQLRVVPYYGCLLGRPSELTGETDVEQPMMMDLLLQAAGADVKWWNYKTECCGASIGMPKAEIQRRLSGKVIEQALAAGAEAIVVVCWGAGDGGCDDGSLGPPALSRGCALSGAAAGFEVSAEAVSGSRGAGVDAAGGAIVPHTKTAPATVVRTQFRYRKDWHRI